MSHALATATRRIDGVRSILLALYSVLFNGELAISEDLDNLIFGENRLTGSEDLRRLVLCKPIGSDDCVGFTSSAAEALWKSGSAALNDVVNAQWASHRAALSAHVAKNPQRAALRTLDYIDADLSTWLLELREVFGLGSGGCRNSKVRTASPSEINEVEHEVEASDVLRVSFMVDGVSRLSQSSSLVFSYLTADDVYDVVPKLRSTLWAAPFGEHPS